MKLIKTVIKEVLEHLGIKYDKPKKQGGKIMGLQESLLSLLEENYDISYDNFNKYYLLIHKTLPETLKIIIVKEIKDEKK